ncbi:conserved exported hypothetical protein [Bradyrhizobium sp. STM 3843]|uniref:hypothetical protein n=1 Tax=Bradyrhizobium sp. STM 3843 TaxID=551947 RepID=UPI000240A46B|nr:hypothetical protein [Bradyrhizobium sp. STM 3843]CCE04671.1 conserved exported hypothetical protein [Bradyrhizobium sp. STM 3843]
MTRSFKTFTAAAVFVATATAAVAQGGFDFAPGMAFVYSSGKTSTMQVAQGDRNHQSMMRHATKVPANTVFFMSGGQLYSTHGMLDPTGNFYIN